MIFAKGVMAESLFLGTQALRNLPRSARQVISRIAKGQSAQPCVSTPFPPSGAPAAIHRLSLACVLR